MRSGVDDNCAVCGHWLSEHHIDVEEGGWCDGHTFCQCEGYTTSPPSLSVGLETES